jgi:hypothetical protein
MKEKTIWVNSPEDTGRPTDTNNCMFCIHSIWAVGIGRGFACYNPLKLDQEGCIPTPKGNRRFNIPSRKYVCESYEWNGRELSYPK